MNPDHKPLGKTSFNNVVSMFVERAKQLKKSHLLLLWHHALKSAFEYLVFKRLWENRIAIHWLNIPNAHVKSILYCLYSLIVIISKFSVQDHFIISFTNFQH